MKDERILITGAAGSIGSELARQLAETDNDVVGLDNNEAGLFELTEELGIQSRVGDIRDMDTINQIFTAVEPDTIYHAAAYKHVVPMEKFPIEAVNTNIYGTHNLLRASVDRGLRRFVYISTDKVVNCDSVMGATKKIGEAMTKEFGGIVVRFGNVLGSRGSVIPIWQRQIDEGQKITLTTKDMTRYFMTIEEACELVLMAGQVGELGKTYIMDMGEPVKIIDLAKQILKKSGRDEDDIEIIGKRPGETVEEKLMTEAERKLAKREGRFWVI